MNKSKGGASVTATTATATATANSFQPRKSASRAVHEDRARFEAETAAQGVAVRWEADELGEPRALAMNKLNEW